MSELELPEESVSSSSSSLSPLAIVALVLGLVGTGLGVAGIVMARGASRELAASQVEIAGMKNSLASIQSELNSQLTSIDQRLERVGASIVPLQRDRQNVQGLNDGLRQLQGHIQQNRDAINQLTQQLTELAQSRATRAPATTGGSSGATADVPADGTYIIQSGDTFGRIAARFGVSVAAIEAANPGVDSRRLQIGQRINLPRSN